MFKSIRKSYTHTIYACYIGYIVQAIINNFAPLLFLTFVADYGLSLEKITLLTTVNFLVQLMVDLLAAKFIDKIGYRKSIIIAHICAAVGLTGLAVMPELFRDAYLGLMVAVVVYAIGGGIIEVLISPIVEACPTEKKEAAMSLLHSFYCWGHVFVVIISTLFLKFAGINNWRIMSLIWAVIPLVNIIYFLFVPIYPIVAEHEKLSIKSLVKNKVFWLIIVLMICAGASEQAMSQWASAFAESGLNVSKLVGDLAGPCAFAIFMGIARAVYGKYSDKIPLRKMMGLSAVMCIICYAIAAFSSNSLMALTGCALCGFSVGIFWPGTFSIAAQKIPGGGTAMYALMALAGDLGCSLGPTTVGIIADANGNNLKIGLAVAMMFPVVMLVGINSDLCKGATR